MKTKSNRQPKSISTRRLVAIIVTCCAALFLVLNFLIVPHVIHWFSAKFPDVIGLQASLESKYPEKNFGVSDQTFYGSGAQNGKEHILTVSVIGKSFPDASEKANIERDICSALGQHALNYNKIVLQSVIEHRFLIFYYRHGQSDTFNCNIG